MLHDLSIGHKNILLTKMLWWCPDNIYYSHSRLIRFLICQIWCVKYHVRDWRDFLHNNNIHGVNLAKIYLNLAWFQQNIYTPAFWLGQYCLMLDVLTKDMGNSLVTSSDKWIKTVTFTVILCFHLTFAAYPTIWICNTFVCISMF